MMALVRATLGATATAAAACAVWTAPALAPVAPPVCEVLRVQRRLDGAAAAGSVALTFDDGPHPQGTPAVLDVLAARGVRATFFLVGEQVARDAGLAREIAVAGHAVALHGHRHRNLLRVGPRALAADLDRAAAVIAAATRAPITRYRPPDGIFTPAGLALARRRGWTPTLWSRWGRDWRRFTTAERIATTATRELAAGDVLLLHDADHYSAPGSWRRTVAALPLILDAIAATGLATVAI
jgi:peptidoglycan/xylan/chitin deacetylase (PgdA/CDA1 family)